MNEKATTSEQLRYKKYRTRAFVMVVLAVLGVMFCFNKKQGGEIGALQSHLAFLGDTLAAADSTLDGLRGLATSQQHVISELEDTLHQSRQVIVEQADSLDSLSESLAHAERVMEDTVTKLITELGGIG